MLQQATGADADTCLAALGDAGGDPKVALLSLLTGAKPGPAREALAASGGVVRAALHTLTRDGVADLFADPFVDKKEEQ